MVTIGAGTCILWRMSPSWKARSNPSIVSFEIKCRCSARSSYVHTVLRQTNVFRVNVFDTKDFHMNGFESLIEK